MSILQLIIGIICLACAFWANNTYVIPGIIRIIVNVILIFVVVVVILSIFGLLGAANIRV